MEGNLAIAQAKQKAAAAREEFLLDELREAGAKLLGKRSTNPRASFVLLGVLLSVLVCRPPGGCQGGE